MKYILHIATSRYGGAGRAAWRLHQAMLKEGLSSIFLSADQELPNKKDKHWHTLYPSSRRWWFGKKPQVKLPEIALSAEAKLMHQEFLLLLPQLHAEGVSIPFATIPLHLHPLVEAASIINLHWVSGMLDYLSFFKHIHQPVVWTLHDMQPFIGLFHYQEDEQNNYSIAEKLDARVVQWKAAALHGRKMDLSLVAPSAWLANHASNSSLMSGLPIEVIPYSLDLTCFKPQNKTLCRKQLGFGTSVKRVLLFVSKHILTRRKGWLQLHQAFEALAVKYPDWTMIAIGHDASQLPPATYQRITPGAIMNDRELSLWYGASDAIVIPSREDNLPNTLLEALACGRPVVTNTSGGMAEHVKEGITGWIGTIDTLIDSLERCFLGVDDCLETEIRRYAEETFEPSRQVKDYLELYKNKFPVEQ